MTQKEILNSAHNNTLFSQTLSFIPRYVFQKLEHKHIDPAALKVAFIESNTLI